MDENKIRPRASYVSNRYLCRVGIIIFLTIFELEFCSSVHRIVWWKTNARCTMANDGWMERQRNAGQRNKQHLAIVSNPIQFNRTLQTKLINQQLVVTIHHH